MNWFFLRLFPEPKRDENQNISICSDQPAYEWGDLQHQMPSRRRSSRHYSLILRITYIDDWMGISGEANDNTIEQNPEDDDENPQRNFFIWFSLTKVCIYLLNKSHCNNFAFREFHTNDNKIKFIFIIVNQQHIIRRNKFK